MSEQSESPAERAGAARGKGRAPAVAAVTIVLIVAVVAVWMFKQATEQLTAVTGSLTAAFRPNVTVNTVVMSAITSVKSESKLVVLTTTFAVEVEKRSSKRIFWDYIDLGDTVVKMKVPGNKVQYYIPTAGVSAKNCSYDKEKRVLVVSLPAPRADEEIVEVQSDPSKYLIETEVGWARLKSYSGKRLQGEAQKALRKHVLHAAHNELLLLKARVEAEKVVRGLLGDLAASLRDGVRLDIKFEQDDDSPQEK